MGTRCRICVHKKRKIIDREIVAGADKVKLAKKYDLPYSSLYAHSRDHIARQMVTGYEMKLKQNGLDVFQELDDLMVSTRKILDTATKKKQAGLALSAIRELRNSLALVSQIQAFLITNQQKQNEASQEDQTILERNERYAEEFQKNITINLLPEEQRIYGELMIKITTGNPYQIKGIIYDEPIVAEIEEPYPIEEVLNDEPIVADEVIDEVIDDTLPTRMVRRGRNELPTGITLNPYR